jgi:RNA polymerase sigma factor (sigma-70 family)
MASGHLSAFLQHLRRSALRRDETGLTDGQLLDAYIRDREEAAFAALVYRHGPMVWGVCRRVLDNDPDAEDAFQAAFLVLVRKAASIVPRDRIANWLYGVARQTAMKARAMAVRRKAREKQVKDMPEVAGAEENSHDLLPFLDQELSRLPEKYRSAIVLCDLEGKSYKEAARHLGCPEGTLSARLARGRTLLAKRLARHGLAVSVGTMALATVPAAVMSNTIKAATLVAAGQAATAGVISAPVAALTEGVLKTMLLTKLKIVSAATLTVLLCLGGGVLMHGASPRTQNVPASLTARPQPENIENEKGEDPKRIDKETEKKEQPGEERPSKNAKLQALLKERLETVRAMADKMKELHKQKAVDQEVLQRAYVRVYKAELDLCETAKERIAILKQIVEVYKEIEDHASQLERQRIASRHVVQDAKLNRLEAEIALEREKVKLATPSK